MEFRFPNAPASLEQVAHLQAVLGFALPDELVAFLLESDGAECGPNDEPGDSLRVLSTRDMVEFNQGYGFPKWLPYHLAVVSDGGDYAFCLVVKPGIAPELWPVVRVPLGALMDCSQVVAENFSAWRASGFKYPI